MTPIDGYVTMPGMKILIQRVSRAAVSVDKKTVGKINAGLCVFVGAEATDTQTEVDWMANKLIGLRIFADENGKMNKSVSDVNGGILLVSQFTLLADCSTGRRPSFTGAGSPDHAKSIFDAFVTAVKKSGLTVQTGIFAADMLVEIANDGPATFMLTSPEKGKPNDKITLSGIVRTKLL